MGNVTVVADALSSSTVEAFKRAAWNARGHFIHKTYSFGLGYFYFGSHHPEAVRDRVALSAQDIHNSLPFWNFRTGFRAFLGLEDDFDTSALVESEKQAHEVGNVMPWEEVRKTI